MRFLLYCQAKEVSARERILPTCITKAKFPTADYINDPQGDKIVEYKFSLFLKCLFSHNYTCCFYLKIKILFFSKLFTYAIYDMKITTAAP